MLGDLAPKLDDANNIIMLARAHRVDDDEVTPESVEIKDGGDESGEKINLDEDGEN